MINSYRSLGCVSLFACRLWRLCQRKMSMAGKAMRINVVYFFGENKLHVAREFRL